MPVVVMILATVLGGVVLSYGGFETPAIVALAVLGIIGIGLILWAQGQSGADLERTRALTLSRENRLVGIQAEADRMRLDLQRSLSQQREAEERARAAEANAERQKEAEMALRESRAEVERLKRDVESARRQAAAAPAAAPVAAAAAAPASPAPTGKREADPAPGTAIGTLLLVDDDPNFLFVASNILRPAGFNVIEAESGQAALERAGQHAGKIDLLVTDMMMPGMNGRQLAQRFTKLRPGVRVLYISGVVDEGSAREAIEGEEADFLGKPFEADTFTAKVRELIRASGGRG